MSAFLFPDNTVLCNFAAVDRLDLLQTVLDGRGRWTAAVAYEAEKSARFLPALAGVTTAGWLDDPIEITDEADVRRVNGVRRAVFGGTDDQPLKHLGEAETCFVIKEWRAFAGSWWISDDREALRYARFQGITTYETIDLMSTAVVNGDATEQQAFDVMILMADKGRSLQLPRSHPTSDVEQATPATSAPHERGSDRERPRSSSNPQVRQDALLLAYLPRCARRSAVARIRSDATRDGLLRGRCRGDGGGADLRQRCGNTGDDVTVAAPTAGSDHELATPRRDRERDVGDRSGPQGARQIAAATDAAVNAETRPPISHAPTTPT